MKIIDLFNISKELEHSSKRESKNTIVGISLSLVVSLVLLYLILAFLFGFLSTAKVNKLNSTIDLNFYTSYSGGTYYNPKDIDKITSSNLVKEKIYYNGFSSIFGKTNDYTYPTITIDDKIVNFDYEKYQLSQDGFTTFYTDKSNKLFFDSEDEYLKKTTSKGVILAGSQFTDDIKEIMVSNFFLDEIGVTDYNSVIGSTMSYKIKLQDCDVYGHYLKCDTEYKDQDIYLFKEYKIVGVWNIDLYNLNSRTYKSQDWTSNEKASYSFFWVKNESVKAPDIEVIQNGYKKTYWYKKDPVKMIEEITNSGYIARPLGFVSFGEIEEDKIEKTAILQFDDLIDEYNYLDSINYKEYTSSYTLNTSMINFFNYYPLFKYVIVLLSIFSSILFIVSLINIIKIVQYSIIKNIHFFAMNKALGLKHKDIRRIYLFKLLIQYIKSIIISFFISFIICISTSIIMNITFNPIGYDNRLNFDISIWYYPISFAVVVLAYFIILYITSFVLTNRSKKINICETLKEQD